MKSRVKGLDATFAEKLSGDVALVTITLEGGKVQRHEDHDARVALLVFALTHCAPKIDDVEGWLRRIPEMSGEPLPSWVTLP